ncbi:head-tail connector protein [Serratia sp. UGAL515B_01]|uniref:head-tail connector protein n=1 Tax=Serratia sp. UGAL515B_01 TaxID=2986763 RepID=UPI0029539859|nr:head-tail connector protein [Serratia sp. UGAL515B_01]WON77831.1 head-tail connector protein [Serratia sp. UGAL515B_01]
MILTLAEIKAQLRLDSDFTEEDELLEFIGNAVQKRTETYINRTLYPCDAVIPQDDPCGLRLPDDIKMGMLLLASHYYENRKTVTDFEQTEVPMGFHWLVSPYRFIPL